MADLSKIKLNGIEYNIKDTVARQMGMPPLATATTDGFCSFAQPNINIHTNNNADTTNLFMTFYTFPFLFLTIIIQN